MQYAVSCPDGEEEGRRHVRELRSRDAGSDLVGRIGPLYRWKEMLRRERASGPQSRDADRGPTLNRELISMNPWSVMGRDRVSDYIYPRRHTKNRQYVGIAIVRTPDRCEMTPTPHSKTRTRDPETRPDERTHHE